MDERSSRSNGCSTSSKQSMRQLDVGQTWKNRGLGSWKADIGLSRVDEASVGVYIFTREIVPSTIKDGSIPALAFGVWQGGLLCIYFYKMDGHSACTRTA